MKSFSAMLSAVAGAVAFASAGAGLEGVYYGESKSEQGPLRSCELILSPAGFSAVDNGLYGNWKEERIGAYRCAVIRLFGGERCMIARVEDEASGALRIVSYAPNLELAREEVKTDEGWDSRFSYILLGKTGRKIPEGFVEKAEKKKGLVEEYVRDAQARRRRNLRILAEEKASANQERHVEDLREMLRKSPERILEIELKYPEKADAEKLGRTDFAYSRELQDLEWIFATADDIRFKEETLVKFIDKCDWDKYRGFPLVFYALMRNEVGAGSRRRLAPRFKPLYGTMDSVWFASFLDHDNTPSEVIREALATKKLGAELEGRLERRLAKRKAKGE